MKKKILSLLLTLVYVSTFTGCFSYKDIDQSIFVTAIAYDVAPDNDIIVYIETFKSQKTLSKGSEKAQRLVFRGRGKTVFEAIRDINLSTSYKVDYTQNKAIIFSDKAARMGIAKFIDVQRRNQQFYLKSYMAVYLGNVEDLMKGGFKEEDYIGLLLSDLINNIGVSSRAIKFQYTDFLNQRTQPDRAVVMTAITTKENQERNSIDLNGGVVFKNDKMVDRIEKNETEAYNFMVNQVKSGTMEIASPTKNDKFVTLEILNSATKTDITPYKNKYYLKKTIKIKANISESQDYITINQDTNNKIEVGAEKNLINNSMLLFNKFKKKNVDIFNISDSYENKYRVRKKDLIKNTELQVIPKVTVEGGGKAGSFY